jgi:hypothetical protein
MLELLPSKNLASKCKALSLNLSITKKKNLGEMNNARSEKSNARDEPEAFCWIMKLGSEQKQNTVFQKLDKFSPKSRPMMEICQMGTGNN